MDPLPRILVIGYGNPAREDDALGPSAAAAVEALALPHVTVDADYQLSVEDAHAVSAHDAVIFVDAATEGPEPFAFTPLTPGPALSFSSHSVLPDSVLALARDAFGWRGRAFVLAIRGYSFAPFREAPTPPAAANLEAALAFLEEILRTGRFPDPTGP